MNEAEQKQGSRSKQIGSKSIYAALRILKEHGGSMRGRDLIEQVGSQVEFDDFAKGRYEKTGNVRWQSILHFYTIDCIKAGFLVKKKGIWYLTPEGENALTLGETQLLETAMKLYRQWRLENPKQETQHTEEETVEAVEDEAIDVDEIEAQGIESLKQHIRAKNPYEVQDLVAALLRGMGYFTPVVAPPGKDGGIDIVAYRDPLGTVSPRIRVQVKHRQDTARVDEIRQLMGLLQKDGDVGIFVSMGGFTSDSIGAARSSHVHVELIDMDRFIALWQDFYERMNDEDKRKLPLRPIYFLASLE